MMASAPDPPLQYHSGAAGLYIYSLNRPTFLSDADGLRPMTCEYVPGNDLWADTEWSVVFIFATDVQTSEGLGRWGVGQPRARLLRRYYGLFKCCDGSNAVTTLWGGLDVKQAYRTDHNLAHQVCAMDLGSTGIPVPVPVTGHEGQGCIKKGSLGQYSFPNPGDGEDVNDCASPPRGHKLVEHIDCDSPPWTWPGRPPEPRWRNPPSGWREPAVFECGW